MNPLVPYAVRCVRGLATAAALLSLGLLNAPLACGQSPEALQWIPETVNAVGVVRVKPLLSSPLGLREGWATELQGKYSSGVIAAPPSVEVVISATQLFGSTPGEALAVFQLPQGANINIREVAKHENGDVEAVAGVSAVLSPRDSYFVRLAANLLGVQHPANRQNLGRWLRLGKQDKGKSLTGYLQNVIATDTTSQIIVAVDLQDVLHPRSVQEWLSSSAGFKQNPKAVVALTNLFSTCQGARITVRVTDRMRARLSLDFQIAPGPEGTLLKEPVIEILGDLGASVEKLSEAEITVEGKSVVLERDIDRDGLRRILSLIRSPSPSGLSGEGVGEQAKVEPNAVGSQQYFHSVKRLVDDLSRLNQRATDYNKTALWHENYARQIEQLPTLGVDPALIQWGKSVSTRLQALAGSLRGVPVELKALDRTMTLNVEQYSYRYASTPTADLYRNGRYKFDTNLPAVRLKQAQAVAQGADDRNAIWQMLNDDAAAIYRQMSSVYGPEFSKPRK